MCERYITKPIVEALNDTPVIVLNGARQTGKSTLCQQLIDNGTFDAQLVTLDDLSTLSAAQGDPLGFLQGLKPHVILDEVQRAP